MTSKARPKPNSPGQKHTQAPPRARGRRRARSSRRSQDAPHQGKSTPRPQQNGYAQSGDEVEYGTHPNWRTTPWPTKARRSTCGWSPPALARRRSIMAGPSASRNKTIIRIKNRLLRKRDAGQGDPDSPGKCTRLHHVPHVYFFLDPQAVCQRLDGSQPLVQLGRVGAHARAEPGDRGAHNVEDHQEEQGQPHEHDHEPKGLVTPRRPSQA